MVKNSKAEQSQMNLIMEYFKAHPKVVCARGISDGVEIHADHIKPKDLGGNAEIINGQTLCARHILTDILSGKNRVRSG
ncbi:MAG: HNH endonuclease [Thaumarchaeota archaeon]|nr:HNH endonuclease [Nitrososphaerota archaeon]